MNKRENLIQGVKNIMERVNNTDELKNTSKHRLVEMYANVEVLIHRAKQEDMWHEIVYPMQSLQITLMNLILK